jgi:hypothetical protein
MIEVLKQALEALELCNGAETVDGVVIYTDQEIAAIKEAIAELESQKPIAYVNVEMRRLEFATDYVKWDTPTTIKLDKIPLYTHSSQRTWVDLTRTQMQDVYFEVLKEHRGGHQIQGQLAFGEALQAKLKEKNI